ncbi:Cdk activating kinase (CAK)/RNA polymerase II transcription initiation/nucleotide excision repair factor TFIIH/TFIIK, cyclin H subunit [Phaffia rhodozyma]|uniref:Cdk activating kinase (CAK)/RNA polymerase II transcription initiation/nucleotide excision repair factor TFIIH/TFIIK, cyclin H subunit n=1 Tax=Phaffia rhodozyma TaxID=264483 RepID=A0A0F7SIA5_PHARH|nr:Cdk activating kinase (CAK)/RNA polymerase II transcription initiation/nucleotide excision repair factor TFIIH/TFIIK, cyclin H subunit [Phaffia rhodozyma]
MSGSSDTPIPKRPLYEESSQFKHWRFSRSKLDELRSALNERSIQIVRENLEEEEKARASTSTDTNEVDNPIKPAALAVDTQYLSTEDESLLVSFYISSIPKTCAGFGLPEVVEATAISYLKRFYLWNTCMDYHPRKVMPACLFLACKTENCLIPIDPFISRFSKLKSEEILELEFVVARSLKFEFTTWGAHKSLKGFALDLQTLPNTTLSTINNVIQSAQPLIQLSRQTDLELTYAPSQIALAALHQIDPVLTERYLSFKREPPSSVEPGVEADGKGKQKKPLPVGTEALLQIFEEIKAVFSEQAKKVLSIERSKEIDRRLRTCANPELIKGTALYAKRKQEEEAQEAEKRQKKAERAQASKASDEAIFGGDLRTIPPADSAPSESAFLDGPCSDTGNQWGMTVFRSDQLCGS